MIELSNLRLEERGDWTYLICDCHTTFAKEQELWFAVPQQYKYVFAPEVYDAFLVTMLYPAMYYKEDIIIDGCVTAKLYRNIMSYVQALLKDFSGELSSINIEIKGFGTVSKCAGLVGTGFSGGIDSFSTFYDHYEKEVDEAYKISALFFANTGSHGDYYSPTTHGRFLKRFELLKEFPNSKKLPFILLDSNVFAFHKETWHLKNGSLRRIAAIIVCQKGLSRYYVSSPCSYKEMMFYGPHMYNHSLEEYADPYLLPLLSPEGLDIIPDGFQYTRSQKTQLIAQYSEAQRFLNVCINHSDEDDTAKNCSHCSKCLRTLMTLESMNAVDAFSKVFDIKIYQKSIFKYKCEQRLLYGKDIYAKDNIDFARRNHKKVPSYIVSVLVCSPAICLRILKKFVACVIGKDNAARIKQLIKR